MSSSSLPAASGLGQAKIARETRAPRLLSPENKSARGMNQRAYRETSRRLTAAAMRLLPVRLGPA
jgi:hypothetical protein